MRKRRLADQLGQHAAGPERDERAEDRVLRRRRRAARRRPSSIGCTSTGAPIRRPPRRTAVSSREVERDAADLRLVRAGRRRLDDGGEAELRARPRRPRPRLPRRAPGRAAPRRPRAARARAGSSQPSPGARERALDDRALRGARSMPSSSGTRPRPAQPLGPLGRAAERARRRLRVREARRRARADANTAPGALGAHHDREHGLVRRGRSGRARDRHARPRPRPRRPAGRTARSRRPRSGRRARRGSAAA